MNITKEHLANKPKQIGTLDGAPVHEISTTGGLWMVATTKHGKVNLIACGPHRAISRHLAMKKEPGIKFTELAKADYVDVRDFPDLINKYEIMTDRLRAMQGD